MGANVVDVFAGQGLASYVRKLRIFLGLSVALGLAVSLGLPAYAAPGDLDTTFSTDGKVTGTFDGSGISAVHDVAIQQDGKILVVGLTTSGTSGTEDFGLARYNTDGSLDTSFDGDGRVTTDVSAGDTIAYSVAIQSNGKIIVAGLSETSSNNWDFALVRYASNGSLDTSFDSDGKVTTDFSGQNDTISEIQIQSDSKIVAAGYRSDSASYTSFALARYNADGSLDTSFDGDGKVTTDFGVGSWGYGLDIRSNGKIIVAGQAYSGPTGDTDFAVARYNSDGSLDAELQRRWPGHYRFWWRRRREFRCGARRSGAAKRKDCGCRA